MSTGAPTSPAGDRVLLAATLALLLVFAWFVSRGWHASILDVHEFRQLQTATSALWMREAGFKLAYETPLFGPPWSIPMEFPLYQAVVAGISNILGTGLEPTARGVSVAFLLLSLPAIALLAQLAGLTRVQCWFVAVTVLSAPLYLFYSRTVMIETTALCAALWFLAALSRLRPGARWPAWALLAAVAGSLAALAKITTFLVACGPGAAIGLAVLRRASTRRERLQFACAGSAAVLIALVAGYVWVRFSDAVKMENPFARTLTSEALANWNWGTWDQRQSLAFWQQFWENLSRSVVSEISLAVALTATALAGRRAWGWFAAGAAAFLLGPLLFANLFFVHDYYYCASAVFMLGGIGVVLVLIWRDAGLPLAARGAVLLLFFAGQLLMYHRGYADFMRRELPQPPAIAEAIQLALPNEEVLVIYGWSWNPLIPYYAQRRTLMIPAERENDADALRSLLAATPPRKLGALLVRPTGAWATDAFIAQQVARLGLAPAAVATSDEGQLFLRADLVDAAWPLLQGRDLPGVQLHAEAAATNTLALAKSLPADVFSPVIFSPLPRTARSRFGASWGDLEGRPVLNLHAPCEFVFDVAPGAIRFVAEVGMPEDAYAEAESTDGIGIRIIALDDTGAERALYQRLLRPALAPEDRGTQRIELELSGAARVALRFTPGPSGELNRDWIYCLRVRME